MDDEYSIYADLPSQTSAFPGDSFAEDAAYQPSYLAESKPEVPTASSEVAAVVETPQDRAKRTVVVSNLDWWCTDEDLEKAFQPFGKPEEITFNESKETGKSLGVAYVTVGTPEQANSAVAALNQTLIHSKQISAAISVEPHHQKQHHHPSDPSSSNRGGYSSNQPRPRESYRGDMSRSAPGAPHQGGRFDGRGRNNHARHGDSQPAPSQQYEDGYYQRSAKRDRPDYYEQRSSAGRARPHGGRDHRDGREYSREYSSRDSRGDYGRDHHYNDHHSRSKDHYGNKDRDYSRDAKDSRSDYRDSREYLRDSRDSRDSREYNKRR